METCFKASWLINMLHDGIGIPRVGLEKTPTGFNGTKEVLEHAKEKGFLDPFQAVDKIDDTEVSWTLGKMVLYAAGQIEPRGKDLPVGFGKNSISGPPTDFQYAGSRYSPVPVGGDDEDDWSDTAEDILHKTTKKSTSGVLLLVLILLFIAFLFRKKDRRVRFYSKVGSALRRNRRPGSPRKGSRRLFGGGKLFGRSSSSYERVLEDGEAAYEFELRDVESDENDHSDSSEGSRAARSSGLATPKLNVVNFSDGPYSDALSVNGNNGQVSALNGSGMPNAMDRSGLVVRTESRERLAPGLVLGSGRRSRNGSPTRKSPLMSPLDED